MRRVDRGPWIVALVALSVGAGCGRIAFDPSSGEVDCASTGDCPTVTIEMSQGEYRRNIAVPFVLADTQARHLDVAVEFRIDAGAWQAAVLAAPATTMGLASSPEGTAHTVAWDSMADLGPVAYPTVAVRVRIMGFTTELAAERDSMSVYNVVRLGVGMTAVCGIAPDRRVRCWGADRDGVLGDGDTDSSPGPVEVSGIDQAIDIAVGAGYYTSTACAVLVDGHVRCWGANNRGQLGVGSSSPSSVPVEVVGIDNARSVAFGNEFACAVLDDGGARCWGNGDAGRLGNGQAMDATLPVPVALTGVTKIDAAVHGAHACALLADGTVWCWGANDLFQLGATTPPFSTVPLQIAGIAGAIDIAIGEGFGCALLTDATVRCWGENDFGQLGAPLGTPRTSPDLVQGLDHVTAIHAGASNACAIRADRSAACWGAGAYHNLLDHALVDSPTPVTLTSLGDVVSIGIDGYGWGGPDTTLCAVLWSGDVACWGLAREGQRGNGVRAATFAPEPSVLADGASTVALGASFQCVLRGGDGRCWGGNVSGNLGDGTVVARETAAPVANLAGAIDLSAGYSFTTHRGSACAVLTGGGVRCWGLGYGDTPIDIAGVTNAVQVEVGESHACARLATGSVSCWGGNYFGELCDGTNTSRSTVADIPGVTTAIDIAMSYRHTCVLLGDRTIKCCGEGDYGELGNGLIGNFNTLQDVIGVTGGNDITTGAEHTCAARSDGTVTCWGAGTGTTPTDVAGVTGVASVEGGGYNTCALKQDATVWCWGSSYLWGELGGAGFGPGQVLTSATAVFAGPNTACARLTSGAVSCWGSNQFGELGLAGGGFVDATIVDGWMGPP